MTCTQLFSEQQIVKRVNELALEIAAAMDLDSMKGELTVIGILLGSFMFVADLLRALDRAGQKPLVDFIRLGSYGAGKESSGEVKLIGDPPKDIKGQNILLVDDIVDTGLSMVYARDLLAGLGAAKIMTCALIDKHGRRRVGFSPDFTGFLAGGAFLVGYGVDHAGQYRHLPYIGVIG